jgi:hydrogenase maturation protease
VTNVLLIGYGNSLRGDDAAGPIAADAIAARARPDVDVRVLHQLLPELAAPIAAADLVIFIDAAVDLAADEVLRTHRITPAASFIGRDTHIADPASLLAAARDLFGRAPHALLLSIPAESFDFGAPLSTRTTTGVHACIAFLDAEVLQ